VLGGQISRPIIQQSLERVSYEGSPGRVSATMRDGTVLEYVLARRGAGGSPVCRVARVTRVLAVATKLKRLLSEGVVGNYKDLAQLGHISGARMSQIMGLTELAPAIQEELQFLLMIVLGRDRIYENELREIARVVDWNSSRSCFGR
jgi:hypothetical protein